MLLVASIVFCPVMLNAQTKSQIKQAEKAGKTEAKRLEKEGWKNSSATPLRLAIKNHLLKTEDFGGAATSYDATAVAVKSLILGGRMARSDIRTQYADMNKSVIKARINDQSQAISIEQADNFVAAYESMVMKEFDGELQKSFSLYRERKDGLYDVRVYFLLDEDKASKTRIRALKNAAAEAQIAQEIADDMSKFINEGFKDNSAKE